MFGNNYWNQQGQQNQPSGITRMMLAQQYAPYAMSQGLGGTAYSQMTGQGYGAGNAIADILGSYWNSRQQTAQPQQQTLGGAGLDASALGINPNAQGLQNPLQYIMRGLG